MNRDEILAKSKDENAGNPDEREQGFETRAGTLALIATFITAIFLHILNRKMGKTSYDLALIISTTYFANYLYRSIKLKAITDIVVTLLFFVGIVWSGYHYWIGIF